MQFKAYGHPCTTWRGGSTKIVLVMKLTTVLLLAAVLQLSAKSSAQTVTFTGKNVPLQQVFATIEAQTGYVFFYDEDDLKDCAPANVSLEGDSVRTALDKVLFGQPLNFNIRGTTVFIKRIPVLVYNIGPPLTGVITGRNGMRLPGATIKLKGAAAGVLSDNEGAFVINVEAGDVLIITYTGYRPLEYKVGKSRDVNIVLTPLESQLDEVTINAGYYTVKQRQSTGSISKVDAATIGQQTITNPLQALQGRVPGIYIEQNTGLLGSNFKVRIRGTNSIRNGNDPLFIIDGIPFTSQTLSDANIAGFLNGAGLSPLNGINPQDIESIEVLKDADATAIYGSRGANGVVLITTKKGSGTSKPAYNLSVVAGGGRVTKKFDVMNTQEYLAMRREAMANNGQTTPRADEYDLNGKWDQNRYTDWQKVLTGGTAESITANASIAGGNQETQYHASVGYSNNNDVFPGTNYMRRYSFHVSLSHTSLNKRFSAQLSSMYGISDIRMGAGDLMGTAISIAPNAPALYDSTGELNWEGGSFGNPLAYTTRKFVSGDNGLLGNIDLGYKITDDIRVSTMIGINHKIADELQTSPSAQHNPIYGVTPASSTLTTGNTKLRSWITEPKITWDKNFERARLSVLVGSTFQHQTNEHTRYGYLGFLSDQSIENPKAAANSNLEAYGYDVYRYSAIFGRINFNWNEKYIINATGRRDGSSRFGPGRQFANLGAIALAWIFSNEEFAAAWPFLSFGKLRGSIGLTGNDAIGEYQFLNTYFTGGSYQNSITLSPARLFNPDYGWETNAKRELALELGFLDNRIQLTAEWFLNQSSNQLVDYKLSAFTGFPSVNRNFPATIRNTGFDLSLTTVNIKGKKLNWETDFNISIPRNKLIAFSGLESSSYAGTLQIGKSLTVQKKIPYLGVDPQTGLYMLEDANKDGNIDHNDRTMAVEAGQQTFGGINNRITWQNFDINIFFRFVKQLKNYYTHYRTPGLFNYGAGNQLAYLLGNQWQKPGDQASYQYFNNSYSDPAFQRYDYYLSSSDIIRDASFIRLATLSIAYRVPEKLIKGVNGRIFLQGQNLWTITNFIGTDPETGSSGLPPLGMMTAGIQLTL